MSIRVCVAGVTGWTGRAIAQAVHRRPEFELVGGVSRGGAGTDVGEVLQLEPTGVGVYGTLEEALEEQPDVVVDYTHPGVVLAHVKLALDRGCAVVVGTSGLSAEQFGEIDERARSAGLGVIAAGNFSLTAALAKHFAGIAAQHIPHWELIDYAHAGKPDAPSGTVRELADYLGSLSENVLARSATETLGVPETRGATLGGAQVHSVRLPGHVLSFEALFGLPEERLSIRHDAGSGADPYVGGTLLAIQRVGDVQGLIRGLDTLLFGAPDLG